MAGTGSLITRRWNGRGGGLRWGPGIAGVESSSGASALVLSGETDPCGFVRAGSETVLDDTDIEIAGAAGGDFGGAQLEIPGAENDFGGAQFVTSGISGGCSAVTLCLSLKILLRSVWSLHRHESKVFLMHCTKMHVHIILTHRIHLRVPCMMCMLHDMFRIRRILWEMGLYVDGVSAYLGEKSH